MKNRSEQTNHQGQTGHDRHTGDYTLYETQLQTHTSKGDAKMKTLDKVLQNTNAGTLNDTTLFYTDGSYTTGTQSEVHKALTETTRSEVQAVLTHGDEALYATLDGWYAAQVDNEVLGQIESWEDFKKHLPEEYELDLQEIEAYLKSQEVVSNLDKFYEKLIVEDEEKTGGC